MNKLMIIICIFLITPGIIQAAGPSSCEFASNITIESEGITPDTVITVSINHSQYVIMGYDYPTGNQTQIAKRQGNGSYTQIHRINQTTNWNGENTTIAFKPGITIPPGSNDTSFYIFTICNTTAKNDGEQIYPVYDDFADGSGSKINKSKWLSITIGYEDISGGAIVNTAAVQFGARADNVTFGPNATFISRSQINQDSAFSFEGLTKDADGDVNPHGDDACLWSYHSGAGAKKHAYVADDGSNTQHLMVQNPAPTLNVYYDYRIDYDSNFCNFSVDGKTALISSTNEPEENGLYVIIQQDSIAASFKMEYILAYNSSPLTYVRVVPLLELTPDTTKPYPVESTNAPNRTFISLFSFPVSANASDNRVISNVWIEIPGGNESKKNNSNFTSYIDFTNKLNSTRGSWYIIWANDTAGNINQSKNYTFTLQLPTPVSEWAGLIGLILSIPDKIDAAIELFVPSLKLIAYLLFAGFLVIMTGLLFSKVAGG